MGGYPKGTKEGSMKFISNVGFILLAVYLIILGLAGLIAGFAVPPIVMSILPIAAGVCILIGK